MHFQNNFPLKLYNSFGINVFAKHFVQFNSEATLIDILNNYNGNKLILGGGSNLLFSKNYDGLVLKNEIQGIEIVKEDEAHIWIKAGAGVSWHELVLYCVNKNYGGVENLSLIPGTVGASPIQNIGAYGVELKDVFFELDAYHIVDKKVVTFNNTACEFGYRDSVFKGRFKNELVILNVTFQLNKNPIFNTSYGAIQTAIERMGVTEISIKAIADVVIHIRQSKLPNPKLIGNAGSFFKNPTITMHQFEALKNSYPTIVGYKINDEVMKLAAGWLIEQCGWKGYRKGDAGCHKDQALVLVNYGFATGHEIKTLSLQIIESVKNKFDIMLDTEVNIL